MDCGTTIRSAHFRGGGLFASAMLNGIMIYGYKSCSIYIVR